MSEIPEQAAVVLDFWLGALDQNGLAAPDKRKQWWIKDPDFDAQLRNRFGALHAQLRTGLPKGWEGPRARLAAVIVLDQFSRNMFRGSGQMFSADSQALALASELVASGRDAELAADERVFLYMPYMHAESREAQAKGLALFQSLAERSSGPAREKVESNVDFARRHMVIIERFERFPHRNALLGRESTPEEEAFLQEPGSSF